MSRVGLGAVGFVRRGRGHVTGYMEGYSQGYEMCSAVCYIRAARHYLISKVGELSRT